MSIFRFLIEVFSPGRFDPFEVESLSDVGWNMLHVYLSYLSIYPICLSVCSDNEKNGAE